MTSHDPDTLQFYADEAERYANRSVERSYEHLDAFLTRLPAKGSVLELGCGGGDDSAHMLAQGFDVTLTDGSPELAAEAQKRLGTPVRIMQFHQIDEQDKYDAVWANACLLHVPRPELAGILQSVQCAIKAGGHFFASYKAGVQEGRDRFGRYYNYPSPDWLQSAYGEGWQTVEIAETMGSGYDNEPTEWLHVIATKQI